jgi:tRNA pseudouridine13 synthase
VEEISLYPFSGEGEHAVLVVEKEGTTTRDVAVGAAQVLGVAPSAVGYAGMKDKRCVAVQAFSVAGVSEAEAARAFEAQGCRVRSATRHRNKLRLGHSAGNRFRAFLEALAKEPLVFCDEHANRHRRLPSRAGVHRAGT